MVFRKGLLILLLVGVLAACENATSNNNNETTHNFARVSFTNNTQFHVRVYRDTVILLFDQLAPGETGTGEIRESVDNHIGTTFRFSYRFKLSDTGDTFSGDAFADGIVYDLEETFVIEAGGVYVRNIPIPENIAFNAAFMRVRNQHPVNASLRRAGSHLLQLGNREMMIPSGETGIYRIGNNELFLGIYALQNVEESFYFPNSSLELGYIHDFYFVETDTVPKIIVGARWRIKPEPTSTWKNEITRHRAANFSGSGGARLNSHLTSVIRRGLSNWRGHYPLNRIIHGNGTLVSGEWGFGVIPTIIQSTGIAEAYEIPLIVARDVNWELSIIPPRNLHAGTMSFAYQTTFNDIIKLGRGYVVLSTYSTGNRTGLWLAFLNEQGQISDSWDIPPANDLESLMGMRLVKLESNTFLVLGSRKTYTFATDEWFTASSMFIYKFQYGNNRKVWSTEYVHPSHHANVATSGLLLEDFLIVLGYASDHFSTSTVVLKINKIDGSIIAMRNFGAANESWRPFSVGSDATGNVFVTGIATEGAGSKAYILKLDSSLAQVWMQKYGDMHDNFLFDLNITENLLTVVGSGNDGSIADPLFYGWQAGIGWILRVDTGTGIVINDIIDENVSAFNSIVRLSDGGFVLAAVKSIDNTEPYWFDTFAIKVNERLAFGK